MENKKSFLNFERIFEHENNFNIIRKFENLSFLNKMNFISLQIKKIEKLKQLKIICNLKLKNKETYLSRLCINGFLIS